MINHSDKKLLNTWTIDIIDTEGGYIDPSVQKIHHVKLTEIRKLLWISTRLYYNYALLYGSTSQQQNSLFWTKAENITYNIPLIFQYNSLHQDIIDNLLGDIIGDGFNSKEILEILLKDNSKTTTYLNYSELLFNHILKIYNTQVNVISNVNYTRHIFLGNKIPGIDIDTFSGQFTIVKQKLLSSDVFNKEFGDKYFYYWDLPINELENSDRMYIKFHNKLFS